MRGASGAGRPPRRRGVTRVGLVPALVLGVAGPAFAGPGGFLQTPGSGTVPAACAVPNLDRMHAAVRSQLGDAYRALQALESAGGRAAADAAPDRRLGGAYGGLGMLLFAADYPDAAGRCLRRAARLAPDEFRWPYYLAHVSIRIGDLDQAVEFLERALAIEPRDFAALVWLVHVQIDRDRPEEAERLLARAWASHPDTQALLYQGGRAALAAQSYAAAVARLEAALRLNPAATVIHYPLFMAYRGLGDLDRARDHLARSGARTGGRSAAGGAVYFPDPLMAEVYTMLRSPQAHRDLGLQAAERGDWPEAARQLGQGVEMAPDNPVMRLNLGTALIRTGDAPAALAQLEAAVRLDPGFAAAHFLIGTLLERSGRDREAVDRFTAAVTADAGLGAAHLRLGDALRRTGRFEAALSHYRQVQGEQARFGEAMALVRLGRYPEARQTLDAPGSGFRRNRPSPTRWPGCSRPRPTPVCATDPGRSRWRRDWWPKGTGPPGWRKRWRWRWPSWDVSRKRSSGRVSRCRPPPMPPGRTWRGDDRQSGALSAQRTVPDAVAGRRAGVQSRSGRRPGSPAARSRRLSYRARSRIQEFPP